MVTNTKEYLAQMEKNKVLVLNACEKIINATALDLYKKIIDRTPVGDPTLWKSVAPANYIPGTLKKSWNLSFNGIQRNTLGQFASGEQITTGHGLSLKLGSETQKLTISNNQPYAERIENGWSTQAPNGMVKVSVSEFPELIAMNVARYKV